MKGMRLLIALVVLAVAHSLVATNSALALTIVSSPFGSSSVTVKIGANGQAPVQVVVWKRNWDGACQATAIGTSQALYDDYHVVGGPGNDSMEILGNVGSVSFCNYWLIGLTYGGRYLDLYGGDGDDRLSCGRAVGDSWLFGENGNDFLFSIAAGNLYGGAGVDQIIAGSTTFTSEVLSGAAGNDCLDDRNVSAAVIDCGSGSSDSLATYYGEPFSTNCENKVHSLCP